MLHCSDDRVRVAKLSIGLSRDVGEFLDGRGYGNVNTSRSRRWPSSQFKSSACDSKWRTLSSGSGTLRSSNIPSDERIAS